MLRGINKQIIEIKCPNNECFEKIMLFVKADNTNVTESILKNTAQAYYSTLMSSYGRIPFYKSRWFKSALLAAVLLGGLFLAMWILFFV